MTNYPKISIITPNYNGAEYLEYTIQSVLEQNYPNLEYIVIDGGSEDGSVDIIKKYQHQISYWTTEPDNGMYHAIQKGFERSTGEIMAWINSDDMYHKKAFFTVAEIFNTFDQVKWLVGATTAYDTLGRTVLVRPSRLFTKYDFYNRDFKFIQQESTFWRRSLWVVSGSSLEMNLKYAADFALWMKFFFYEKLYVSDALIGGFRWRTENQLSLDHPEEYLEETDSFLSSIILKKEDKRILLNYNSLQFIDKCLKKLKLFNFDWMIRFYRRKYFNENSKIVFDRHLMKFTIYEGS